MLQLPREEKSYWRSFYTTTLYPELANDLEIDVAIVGGGITGLTSAYLLKQAGLKVAVLEKSTVAGGTSGRTTGKVTSQHNLIYHSLQSRLGKETARVYGVANQAAVKQIEEIINNETIRCNWQREDNYVYSQDPEQTESFKQEAAVAAELGLPASFETNLPIPFSVQAAVKFTNQAKINSQQYLLGLAKAVDGNGSYVFEHSNVVAIRDGAPGRIKTRRAKVTAKNIIVATNVPTMPLAARGGYCLLEYPKESYIVAGRLPKAQKGMYISPDKHNYSILPVENKGERFILIGGESHISGLRLNTKAKYQRLADYAEKHFGVTAINHCWSDRDYLSYDDVPLIGKLYPWSKNLYVGTAFMKWGLSNGTVAAIILRDLITGTPNAWNETFDSTRSKPFKSIPRVAAKYLSGKG